MVKWILALCLVSSTAGALDSLSTLPVQDGGRIKPYDTFARESLELVYGKTKYQGKPAQEIVLTWLLQPNAWQDREFVEIRYNLLKKALGFSEEKKHFSPQEIFSSPRLSTLFQELGARREKKEKLDPYYQSISRLESQLFILKEMAAGSALRLIPRSDGDHWISVAELSPQQQEAFNKITEAFIETLSPQLQQDLSKKQQAQNHLSQAVQGFTELARAENAAIYPSPAHMSIEVHYNDLHPLRLAWVSYLAAAVLIALMWLLKKGHRFYFSSWFFMCVGLLLHLYGFALRIYLTGRAPVSNMYETVVWVALGAVVFSLIFAAIYRWAFILMSGAIVAILCLVLADMAPLVLDPALQPLEPVLRSNFWLTVHVLTITISYAAFFLAFILGDIGLIYVLKDEKAHLDKIKSITLAAYRSLQVGVSFLAPGIILGGVWADYSWGRFWGWDPKETWALIVLLGYMAVLHGRLVGWLKYYGLLVSSIICFALVIMAWYGVNFILGAGLHSYGFGAGGVEYVATFVGLHILFVVYVSAIRSSRQNELKK